MNYKKIVQLARAGKTITIEDVRDNKGKIILPFYKGRAGRQHHGKAKIEGMGDTLGIALWKLAKRGYLRNFTNGEAVAIIETRDVCITIKHVKMHGRYRRYVTIAPPTRGDFLDMPTGYPDAFDIEDVSSWTPPDADS